MNNLTESINVAEIASQIDKGKEICRLIDIKTTTDMDKVLLKLDELQQSNFQKFEQFAKGQEELKKSQEKIANKTTRAVFISTAILGLLVAIFSFVSKS